MHTLICAMVPHLDLTLLNLSYFGIVQIRKSNFLKYFHLTMRNAKKKENYSGPAKSRGLAQVAWAHLPLAFETARHRSRASSL